MRELKLVLLVGVLELEENWGSFRRERWWVLVRRGRERVLGRWVLVLRGFKESGDGGIGRVLEVTAIVLDFQSMRFRGLVFIG